MKVPVIRQFFQAQSAEQLESALSVLESFSEFRGVNEAEMDVVGELMTNICGALEVHAKVAEGAAEKDALNGFAQRVMGSIDR